MKTFKIGLIGFGFIGKVHAKAYQSLPYCFGKSKVNAQITAILRSRPDEDKELISSFDSPLVTSDVNEFFSHNFNVLDICSPNDSHYLYALKAIDKGISIYCEKPITARIENARKLTQKVQQAGISTHTAFVYRYFPAIQQAKQIIEAGRIGEVFHFRFQIYHGSYNDPSRPISWRLKDDQSGGGAFTDLGIHLIDLTHFLLGDIDWIQCQTRTFIKNRPVLTNSSKTTDVDVDDWTLCTIGLKSGGIGSLETSRMSGGIGSRSTLEIFGSKGSIIIDFDKIDSVDFFDLRSNRWSKGIPPEMKSSPKIVWPEGKKSLGRFVDAHTTCILDFLNCQKDKKNSDLDFNTALKAQEVLHTAYQSAKLKGKVLKINR